DLTDPGAFETIHASFDFRILPGTNGLADGFHFLMIPTSTFGSAGDGPNVLAEEPNSPGAFGVAFDVYPGINNVALHWNNAQHIEHVIDQFEGISYRSNAVFNRAQIDVQRVGNGSNVSLTLVGDSLGSATPVYKAFEVAVGNFLPYEHRVQFGARTGGENMNVDIDNVNVAYSNPFAGIPAAPATGHLLQDFDRSGTTGYQAVQVNQRTGTVYRTGPLLNAGDAGSDGAFLRLTPDGEMSLNNHVAFNRAIDGGASNMRESLKFDVRFGATDATPADGLGVLFLPVFTQNGEGQGLASSEEPNHLGVLALGFDIFSNGPDDPAPAVSLHWDGVELADQPVDPSFGLNQFHRFEVIRDPVDGGVNVSVFGIADVRGGGTTQVPLLTNVFVAGARNYDYRMEFVGRTGGLDAAHDLDNVSTSQVAPGPLATTQATFTDARGSAWKGYRFGGNAGPVVMNEFGTNGDFLRLAHDANLNQQNSVAFDQQLNGFSAGISGIVADFDFRMADTNATGPADGLSLMLIPVATYGTTGPGVNGTVNGFIAEEPNVVDVFGLAFDIYNGAGVPWNEASLHWNGGVFAALDIDPSLIDLDAGVFHHARLTLTQSETDVLASLTLTPDIFGVPGTPVSIFTDVVLPGMSFFDYRVEFAARTGGLDASMDIDNVLLQIPEPSSALLMLGSALLLARRRRGVAAI
ncbi:MAG TPA: PEP-CTERM sorting domain-containing protein, partial [Chthoniobacteraceae bacterium]|nr:PEP-CTERM sorting domain-containing protein [Chthoniobacteraceae bacterium]